MEALANGETFLFEGFASTGAACPDAMNAGCSSPSRSAHARSMCFVC
jgi:hypothetical protein